MLELGRRDMESKYYLVVRLCRICIRPEVLVFDGRSKFIVLRTDSEDLRASFVSCLVAFRFEKIWWLKGLSSWENVVGTFFYYVWSKFKERWLSHATTMPAMEICTFFGPSFEVSGVTDPGHDPSGRGQSNLGSIKVILAWPGQKGHGNFSASIELASVRHINGTSLWIWSEESDNQTYRSTRRCTRRCLPREEAMFM